MKFETAAEIDRLRVEIERRNDRIEVMSAALRAILFQVVQGPVLERDACITQARAALFGKTPNLLALVEDLRTALLQWNNSHGEEDEDMKIIRRATVAIAEAKGEL